MQTIGASASWKKLGKDHERELSAGGGWDQFRRTIATRYFTDPDYTEADIELALKEVEAAGIRIKETDYLEGSPVHIQRGEQIITQDLLTSACELHSMERFIDFAKVKTFAEIGGGYGRMALLLLQRYPHIAYTIIDVPPAIDVSRKFLSGKYNVTFLSPEDARSLPAVDVMYSSSVMSELDTTLVSFYFKLAGEKATYFYIKDWKRGHHINSMPLATTFLPRLANKLYRAISGTDLASVRALLDSYRIHEETYAKFHPGWQELLHADCLAVTAFSPHAAKEKYRGERGFFEILYKVR